MVLERYSHVMHLTSQVAGELARRQERSRRAARHVPGRHGERRAEGAGDGDHRRARADEARRRTPGSSATSTSPATSTPRSRSARWCGATARRACRRAPASSPTPSPPTKTWNAGTRPGRCSPQPPRRARLVAARHVRRLSHDRSARRPRRAARPAERRCRRRPVGPRVRAASPGRTRSRSSRRWCPPISTRSPTASSAAVAAAARPRASSTSTFRLLRVAPTTLWLDTDPGLARAARRLAHRFKIRVDAESRTAATSGGCSRSSAPTVRPEPTDRAWSCRRAPVSTCSARRPRSSR